MKADSIIQLIVAALTALVAMIVLVFAFRSGALRRVRLGAFEIEASERDKQQAKALIHMVTAPSREAVPFESEQLAQYYAQVLAQSRVSFWFSLLFASLGFVVIIVAVFFASTGTVGATVAQFAAGLVMDAVASLFFVQSKNAQKSMGEFFDKLRKDRQQAESRSLCDSVQNSNARDALRIQLSLFYAGIENSNHVANAIIGSPLIQYDTTPKLDGK